MTTTTVKKDVLDSTSVVPQSPPSNATAATVTPHKPESALKSFISGGVGGVCIILVGHPLDLIKVRMQTGAVQQGVLSMFVNTFKETGITGLYRGVSAPLVAVTPYVFVRIFLGGGAMGILLEH
jgi:solute carrier family 25 carnitine/acylcarnitine transporter 20/29